MLETRAQIMAELLLELFSEEIPARMQARAREDLARLLGGALSTAGLEFEADQDLRHAAPAGRGGRRPAAPLARYARGEEGSARRCARSRDARASSNRRGSTRRTGPRRATTRKAISTSRRSRRKAAPPAEVVAEIVPEIVRNFPWPKSMRWGSGRLRWVRPLHSILCLLDGKVVPFEIDGIKSGKETRGHRFMAPEPFA